MPNGFVVVTGGAYEEGLSVAEALAHGGARVSIWDEAPAELEAARSELAGLGLEVDARSVNLGDPGDVARVYDLCRAEFGPPTSLFNMATLKNSYLLGDPETRTTEKPNFWETDLEKLARVGEINVIGTMLCSALAARDMVAASSGSIVNFSTSDSTKVSAGHVPYGPSKAMVEAFSTAITKQLRPHNVRVNVISSGGMVNRRGRQDPRHVPAMWASELVNYLSNAESERVTGQLYRGSSLTPLRPLVTEGEDES